MTLLPAVKPGNTKPAVADEPLVAAPVPGVSCQFKGSPINGALDVTLADMGKQLDVKDATGV